MQRIIFISTVHTEIGECNADELYRIIKSIGPEVIFLEAVNETYSQYDEYLFSSFGIFHEKLEVSAIQMYSLNTPVKYIPVLDNGLSATFDDKYKIVSGSKELRELIDNYNSLACDYGFKFLNSDESMNLQEKMRMLESHFLKGSNLDMLARLEIDAYENAMIHNIYSYCDSKQFNSAIFMCGVAHRKSIIEKLDRLKAERQVNPNWIIF